MKSRLFFVFTFYLSLCVAGENHELRMLLESNIPSRDMIVNLKEEIHRSVYRRDEPQREIDPLLFGVSPCKNCQPMKETTENPRVLAFISFSLPESVLLALSKELEKAGGVFVIRGLPGNSFSELSKKLIHLTKLGMKTPVWLDPISFRNYKIESVPAFVVVDGEEYHKISGNVSLDYALKQLEGSA